MPYSRVKIHGCDLIFYIPKVPLKLFVHSNRTTIPPRASRVREMLLSCHIFPYGHWDPLFRAVCLETLTMDAWQVAERTSVGPDANPRGL